MDDFPHYVRRDVDYHYGVQDRYFQLDVGGYQLDADDDQHDDAAHHGVLSLSLQTEYLYAEHLWPDALLQRHGDGRDQHSYIHVHYGLMMGY